MKKIVPVLLALILALSLLAGCGEKAVTDLDLTALSDELLDSGVYSDKLSAVSSEIALSLYNLDSANIADCVLYCSTGATAEELAVFEATSEDAAGRIVSAIENRISAQTASYETYVPEEVPKLEDAIVSESGVYVVFCCCADSDAAAKILDSYSL